MGLSYNQCPYNNYCLIDAAFIVIFLSLIRLRCLKVEALKPRVFVKPID